MTTYLTNIKRVLNEEAETIEIITKAVDSEEASYNEAVEKIMNSRGKLIFMGVGKTGHIGAKLAATFSSLGIPSFFVHATESMHGDLGMITKDDIVVLISNSGETKESLAPVRFIKRIGAYTISMTRNNESSLAKACDLSLLVPVDHEADRLNLAPTNSSTAALAVGDALACTISEAKGFSERDFAGFHPGGALGQKLFDSQNN